jgi:hypothetical protein
MRYAFWSVLSVRRSVCSSSAVPAIMKGAMGPLPG